MLSTPAFRRTRLVAATSVLILTVLTVGSVSSAQETDTDASAAASVTAGGSVEQVFVTGAEPGTRLSLVDRRGDEVGQTDVGPLGGAIFREVEPGSGYRVRSTNPDAETAEVTVLSGRSAPPDEAVYDQPVPTSGYGYLTTRDGTKLAMTVRVPGGPGPFPTLIEYSGYGYANPDNPESSISTIANLLGYAVVDVNMRGTGCSGGAFDYFEPLQSLDGYDVIETIARQPWVMNNKVGMMGVSYGGISQLFVASTRPPHLAAITPLSVIDNTATTLYPGGLLNSGFALSWAKGRVHDALPASPTGGQGWAWNRIQAGDATCEANQILHPQAIDLLQKIADNRYYVPDVADPLAPVTFVDRIRVPTFLACQFTDEQTGGHCPELARHFTGTHRKWFTFTNGTHIDSLSPATFTRWFDFLELYVANRKPELSPTIKALAPIVFKAAMGVDGLQLPDDPIQAEPSYQAARRAFERLPEVRILFDNGAGAAPGAPVPGFEQSFDRLPLPGTRAQRWYLGADGSLSPRRPRQSGSTSFTWDASTRPATDFSGSTGSGGLWSAKPTYHWEPPGDGHAASYLTAPLDDDTIVVGTGALYAWVKTSSASLDLQVTVSEVRPDGKETYVQSGWLRGTGRKLDRHKSSLLEPVPTLTEADDSPIPTDEWVKMAIPLYYQGHAYRSGSQIRLLIQAPGGDQPIWQFGEAAPKGSTPEVAIASSRRLPSMLVLPAVRRVGVPTDLPPCPGLRGEPCRDNTPYTNQAGPDPGRSRGVDDL